MESSRHIGVHQEWPIGQMADQDLLPVASALDRANLTDQQHDAIGRRSGHGQLRGPAPFDRILVVEPERLRDEEALRKRVTADLAPERGIQQLAPHDVRSEEHTSELQSLMRISYAVFCLKKKKPN